MTNQNTHDAIVSTDNLTSLHDHEEGVLAKSLAAIKADVALFDHWNLVAEAMNVIYAFSHDHVHGSDNELTLQYLGIRLNLLLSIAHCKGSGPGIGIIVIAAPLASWRSTRRRRSRANRCSWCRSVAAAETFRTCSTSRA